MKNCCAETFRKSIEEVLLLIRQMNITDIAKLVITLEYSVKSLKEKEEKNARKARSKDA